jgi:hypothetical protein
LISSRSRLHGGVKKFIDFKAGLATKKFADRW